MAPRRQPYRVSSIILILAASLVTASAVTTSASPDGGWTAPWGDGPPPFVPSSIISAYIASIEAAHSTATAAPAATSTLTTTVASNANTPTSTATPTIAATTTATSARTSVSSSSSSTSSGLIGSTEILTVTKLAGGAAPSGTGTANTGSSTAGAAALNSDAHTSSGIAGAAIAGIVIGIVAIILIFICLLFLILRLRKKRDTNGAASNYGGSADGSTNSISRLWRGGDIEGQAAMSQNRQGLERLRQWFLTGHAADALDATAELPDTSNGSRAPDPNSVSGATANHATNSSTSRAELSSPQVTARPSRSDFGSTSAGPSAIAELPDRDSRAVGAELESPTDHVRDTLPPQYPIITSQVELPQRSEWMPYYLDDKKEPPSGQVQSRPSEHEHSRTWTEHHELDAASTEMNRFNDSSLLSPVSPEMAMALNAGSGTAPPVSSSHIPVSPFSGFRESNVDKDAARRHSYSP